MKANYKANKNIDVLNKCDALLNWKKHNKEARQNRYQDPFWYAKDEASIKRMASLPWNEVIGAVIPGTASDVIPGAMVFPYKRCAGSFAEKFGNTLTRVSDVYFQYMTQGFTGVTTDFEHPDLLMTAMAGGSLAADMEEGKRAFGTLNYFTEQNDYYSRKMFAILGFDYDSFTVEHSKADFVEDYNIRVDQINALIAVPKGFMATDRWIYLAQHLFTDNSDPEFNTLLIHKCVGSMEYRPFDALTGTCLKWKNMYKNYDHFITYEEFFEYIDEQIKALTGTDQRNIFGALRRVYSDDKFFKLEPVNEKYATPIDRNDIVSAALHNASFFDEVGTYYNVGSSEGSSLNLWTSGSGYPVVQDAEGNILCHIYARNNVPMSDTSIYIDYDEERIIDMYGHMDTAANVLDVTATMAAYLKPDFLRANSRVLQPIATRSEVFLTPRVYSSALLTAQPTKIDPELVYTRIYLNDRNEYTESDTTFHEFLRRIALSSHVNSHPLIRVIRYENGEDFGSGDPDKKEVTQFYVGEVDKYCGVDNPTLAKLQARTLSTLFNLPRSDRSVTK